jgi:hypothetical protein
MTPDESSSTGDEHALVHKTPAWCYPGKHPEQVRPRSDRPYS